MQTTTTIEQQSIGKNTGSCSDMQVILDHTLEGFVLTGLDGRIRAFNKKAEESIFLNVNGLVKVGDSIYTHIDPSRAGVFATIMSRIGQGETIEYQRSFNRMDNSTAWFEFSLSPVWDDNKVVAVCMKGRDITHRKDSQTMYNSLFSESALPKFVFDKKTYQILEVNNAVTALYGYSREELLTMTAYEIRIPEEHEFLEKIKSQGSSAWNKNTIGTHRKKTGEHLSVQVAVHEINYKGSAALLSVVSDISETLALQQQLANEKVNTQRTINRATIRAQEAERFNLGTELHDNVNQMLASTKLYLNYALSAPQDNQAIIGHCMATLEKCIAEIGRLSRSLVPPSLGDLGVQQAIKDLVASMGFKKNTLSYAGLPVLKAAKLSPELQLCIYRILQEQLVNIVKHAAATKVKLSFVRRADYLEFIIEDNGIGFDLKAKRKGIGLMSIANRASVFNGKVEVQSTPGQGTSLSVRLPL